MTSTPYWLRVLIAWDQVAQTSWRYGKPGVTMSARIGTAAAHGHRWGLAARWLLETAYPLRWFFGPGHCAGAIRHDSERARQAIAELSDPVVSAYANADWREP